MTPDVETRLGMLERDLTRQIQRLEDEIERTRLLAEAIRRLPEELATIRERVGRAIYLSKECLDKQDSLEAAMAEREREQARERKSDRRWLIGTCLSSAALVIAALGILANL